LVGAQNAHRGKIGKKAIIIYVGCSLPATLRTMREKVQLFLLFRLLRWVCFETISNLMAQAKTKIVIVSAE
jgi:hypothetical protein